MLQKSSYKDYNDEISSKSLKRDKVKMELSKIISLNIRALRVEQKLTQAQLAKRSGVPRSTLATVELGESSPSVEFLSKVGKALGVSLDELVSLPRPKTLLLRAKDIPKHKKSGGQVTQTKILPDPIFGMEIDHVTLKPGARMRGVPHIKDTREYFCCLKGEVEIYCDGEKFSLEKGDVLAFPGDRAHSYYNRGRSSVEGFSVVVLAKV